MQTLVVIISVAQKIIYSTIKVLNNYIITLKSLLRSQIICCPFCFLDNGKKAHRLITKREKPQYFQ